MIKKISGGAVDGVFYYPLDLSFIVSAAVKDIDPSAYILVETEAEAQEVLFIKPDC